MRPRTHRKIAAAVLLAAALAVAGCSAAPTPARSAAPASTAPPSTTAAPAAKAPPATTTAPAAPVALHCTLAPASGQAGSTTTITCTGFRPGERVAVGFEAVIVATTRAAADGALSTPLQVPDGFAGSHYPGRHDTFHARGRVSGRSASATFTVSG